MAEEAQVGKYWCSNIINSSSFVLSTTDIVSFETTSQTKHDRHATVYYSPTELFESFYLFSNHISISISYDFDTNSKIPRLFSQQPRYSHKVQTSSSNLSKGSRDRIRYDKAYKAKDQLI